MSSENGNLCSVLTLKKIPVGVYERKFVYVDDNLLTRLKVSIFMDRGVARTLLRGRQNRGSGGQKSPSGVQGQSPCGGLGAKPPEAGNICSLRLLTEIISKNI